MASNSVADWFFCFLPSQLLSMFDMDLASTKAECTVLLLEEVTLLVATLEHEEVQRFLSQWVRAPLPAWDTVAGIRQWLPELKGLSQCVQAGEGSSSGAGARNGDVWQQDAETEWASKWSFSNWKQRTGGYILSVEQESLANPLLQEWACAARLQAELMRHHKYEAVLADDGGIPPNFSQVFEMQ